MHIHFLLLIILFPLPRIIRGEEFKDLIVVTPTYQRPVQEPALINLCSVLTLARNLTWIIVEDSYFKTKLVYEFVQSCPVDIVHLSARYERYMFRVGFETRGVIQRNKALLFIRDNSEVLFKHKDYVVYFADDDNIYHPDLFNEIRKTKRLSTLPVGFSGMLPWEGCVTSPDDPSRITSMQVLYMPERDFPIDMAGFAVSLEEILRARHAFFKITCVDMIETCFLRDLGFENWRSMEPLANGCSKILVWHTRFKDPFGCQSLLRSYF